MKRVIDKLRERIPGEWWYSHRRARWCHESGLYVYRATRLESEHAIVTRYCRSDTKEEAFFDRLKAKDLSSCCEASMDEACIKRSGRHKGCGPRFCSVCGKLNGES